MTRYRYISSAVADDVAAADGEWVEQLSGQVGTRLPHVWLEAGSGAESGADSKAGQGEQLSSLDLCGPGFALLVGPEAADWSQAVQAVSRETGIDIALCRKGEWFDACELPADGAVLVRPDAHVAARSDRGLSPETLPGIVRALLSRTPAGF
ncbi:hypothetical protein [Actinospica robiniae]|uniref:aromatic-ring hydroxylase C-terminal domain-containing protein n=1 Tax=Actinospica robiniae TaxID=304901 RepID=UPI00316ABF5C